MNQIPYAKEQLFRANVKLMEQIVRNFRKRIGGIRTRREKLEVIKEKYQAKRLNGRTSVLSVNPTELDWLIKQAERAQELEEFNRILSSDKSMFIEELVREQQQNKRYREAIEFGIEYLKNSDIRQVQLVVTALKTALEGED